MSIKLNIKTNSIMAKTRKPKSVAKEAAHAEPEVSLKSTTVQVKPAQEPRPEKLLRKQDGSKALTALEYEQAQGINK